MTQRVQLPINVDCYFGWLSEDPTPDAADIDCVIDGETIGVVQSADIPEVFIFGPVKKAYETLDIPCVISVEGATSAILLLSFVTACDVIAPTNASHTVAVVYDGVEDLSLVVMDGSGDIVVENDNVDFDISDVDDSVYVATFDTPEAAGVYAAVILAANEVIEIQPLIVGLGGKQTCKFVAARIDGGGSTSITSADILISHESTMEPLLLLTSDEDGAATANLPAGLYVATLRKEGYVFNSNNFLFGVSTITSAAKVVHLTTGWKLPDFRLKSLATTVAISGFIRSADGQPIANARVLFEPLDSLFSEGSTTGFSKNVVYVDTVASGFFSIRLVPGLLVRVSIPSIGVSRTIEIPESDAPLFTIISTAADPFAIVNTTTPRKVSR